jgi:RHS repeat-associated protein
MTLSAVRAISEVSHQRSRSTGKERDAESGLDYFGARYYGSSMGRFSSHLIQAGLFACATPGNPQSLNLYSYVL